MKLNSPLTAIDRLVSEAGSEQSTNCRWWDSRTRFVLACRLDLNHPPTSVGGITWWHEISITSLRAYY